MDARFVDGFCACANDGLGVVRDGGIVGSGLGRYGERGTVYVFVCFVVEDDTGEIVFSTFAMGTSIAEVGQDVFLGHFGDGGKEAGVEPDVERALV